ncbi:unnamed protein product [Effrenium voratum]|uniref:Uncharacterized protein n=1 Tax=Effrenium voratum TaxID=2562239 RepID=A0AA36MMS4_9DINO|nr:unnamed protein product [Effrenium voratum]CAJ1415674.1 unnamed protein product [Effrenium voratum]
MADAEEEEITHPAQFWEGKPEKMITLRLVMEKSLTQAELTEYDALEEDAALERVRRLKSIHLHWLGLSEINGLEPFEQAEVLYLQANRLRRIENLDWLPRLQFLALQCNRIAVVENLTELRQLQFLDLSRNQIADFDARELPRSIDTLNLLGNACVAVEGYREKLVAHLPNLAQLDDDAVADSPSHEVVTEPLEGPAPGGLGAYWMRKDLHAGVTADMKDLIEAYSIEALSTSEFSQKVADATARSRARREATPLPAPMASNSD